MNDRILVGVCCRPPNATAYQFDNADQKWLAGNVHMVSNSEKCILMGDFNALRGQFNGASNGNNKHRTINAIWHVVMNVLLVNIHDQIIKRPGIC